MDVGEGLSFQLSAGAMGFALAVFGFTGIGADEITKYTYWCVEKGYAAWSGPNDGSDEWATRARGWISVMKKDAWLSWAVYTLSTIAFYVLGAAVLHPAGPANRRAPMSSRRSPAPSPTPSARGLRSSSWSARVSPSSRRCLRTRPGFARQMTNTLAVFGAFDWNDPVARNRWLKVFIIGLPIVWGAFAFGMKAPLTMVLIAGVINAFWLMAIVVAVIFLHRTQTDPRLRDGAVFTVYFMISAVVVFGVGVMTLLDQF